MPLAFRQWHLYRFDFMAEMVGVEPTRLSRDLKHFEFCVPNAVCAPPGSKQAVLSGLF